MLNDYKNSYIFLPRKKGMIFIKRVYIIQFICGLIISRKRIQLF